jgi:hypothetical protein
MNTGFSMRSYRSGLFAVLIGALAFGCHSGGAPESGTVTPGPAREALVFADHISGTEANYTVDADEAATAAMTGPNGEFTLSATPGYDYVVVTQFGENTLTGRPAMQMLTPAGARSVSLLTTLVALDPDARPAIESLGVAYDADLSAKATPAALLLVHSMEAIVAAVTDGLDPAGDTLLAADINVIQQTLLTAIANRIQDQTAAQLIDPATLTATLATAVTDALVSIESNTSIATIVLNTPAAAPFAAGAAAAQSAPLPAFLVDQIVNTVANAISASTGTTTLSTTTTAAQNIIITPQVIAIIAAATDMSASAVAAQATVTARHGVNPPPIISGTPPATATVGVRYSFKPTVTDTDNDADFYLFIIKNKPRWAKFNLLTGELTGTPKAEDVGTTTGIVITVIDILDCLQHASLPAFDITVVPVTGSTGSTGGGGGF